MMALPSFVVTVLVVEALLLATTTTVALELPRLPITTFKSVVALSRPHYHEEQNEVLLTGNTFANNNIPDRRAFLSSISSLIAVSTIPASSNAAATPLVAADGGDVDGISVITRSNLGTSIRKATVRGAQVADKIDEKWERFSDSLRDENKCDPITNRRLFDNGFRKDGTPVGNPVLGGLCTPEPLKPLNGRIAELVLGSAEEGAVDMLGGGDQKRSLVRSKVVEIDDLVGPSFARGAKQEEKATGAADNKDDDNNVEKRYLYNRSVYTRMRSYGELILANQRNPKAARLAAADFELQWGNRLLPSLVPTQLANRKSFKSPFPPLSEEDKGDLDYKEGDLLDALGTLSAALDNLQDGGIIGHWEISIPTDDYGEVVTIAVDDDISLGAQGLLREGRGLPLNGSVVTALTRGAFKKFGITAGVDAFFLDPSTTKQDVFNPTQLLLNLSNIKSI